MITAQFNDAFLPVADGVVQGVKNYAYWLNKKYGKAYVVAPETPGYTDNEEFEVIRFKSIPLINRKPYRVGLPDISIAARKRIMDIPLDIIHARSPFGAGAFARQIATEKNIPMVASFHSQYYYDFKSQVKSERLTMAILKGIANFYEKADAVWTVNDKTAHTLRSYGYRGDIDVIGNGIDMKRPDDYEDVRKKAGSELGIGDDEFAMLYVGQLVWHKNLRIICEGLARIKKEGRKFKMIFVGEGEAGIELKELVESLGLTDDIIFTGKISDRNRIMTIYARGDLFLFPSIYDTFGIVAREAAEMLCPCLMVEGTNAASEIVHNENGFLCHNEVKSFSDSIMEIMDDPALLEKAGTGASVSLPESWEMVVDKAHAKYEKVIRDFKAAY